VAGGAVTTASGVGALKVSEAQLMCTAPGRSAVAVLIALRIVVATEPASIRPAHLVTGLKTSVWSTTWWVKKACRAVSI